jgi:endoglucanase
MQKKYSVLILLFLFLLFESCQVDIQAEPEIFIRFNQLGYLPNDIKSAIILSYHKLEGKRIFLCNSKTKEKVLTKIFEKPQKSYGNFDYTYQIDFTSFKTTGEYYFQFGLQKSYFFRIDKNVFQGVADTLLEFFKVQRCGYTDPMLHAVCHFSDAGSLIENHKTILKKVDVTGGWHDAGDYIKIFNTTAFSTYMLLFSYDFAPEKFRFDKNKNNVADILEEAKVGLDWLLRSYYENNKLITQVQDMKDHEVGWRLPENDPIGFDRPAFVGIGKNLIGIYTATMSLAYRIWKYKLNYPEFANQCLTSAQNIYSIYNTVADVDSSGTGVYLDKKFEGKMALGAIELYLSTYYNNYLQDAVTFADKAGSDYWWSWGDINVLAQYRLSKVDQKYITYIEKNLIQFNAKKNDNTFNKGMSLSWGTNVSLLGITLHNILYKRLTNDSKYDSVATFSRDFILGRNSWGVSFLGGFGKNHTKNFHHQISYLKGRLPGGFSAGPASRAFIDKANIPYAQFDKYAKFQTTEDYYRDDRQDYITNEPTITGNATAIFVFGNLKGG